jgi:hypothetical protein
MPAKPLACIQKTMKQQTDERRIGRYQEAVDQAQPTMMRDISVWRVEESLPKRRLALG